MFHLQFKKVKKMVAICSSKMAVTPCITSDKHALDFQYCANLKYPLQLTNLGCNIKK